ncbi:MAG: efflux RND transporter periplasmic adaptor subunit [Acidobacteriota bacterium]|nr:efflux RND transporter periplasmic adaptor subunit [Acidobacteriota bacterium]
MNEDPPRVSRTASSRLALRLAAVLSLAVLLFTLRRPIIAWFAGPPAASPASPAGPGSADSSPAAGNAAPGIAYYTCSMHPSVRQERPGRCPICGMELTAVRRAEAATGEVVLDDGRRQEIGIRTEVVGRRRTADHLLTIGKVAFDESRLADVTVKFQGYVSTLPVSQTGQRVAQGQILLTLYSPDLYLAQQEYLGALASQAAARRTPNPDRADYLVAAAAQKLRLWDLGESEINQLNERREPAREVPVRSPLAGVVIEKAVVQGSSVQPGMKLYRIAGLDRVRVEAQVYQADLSRVRLGQGATVRSSSLPGRELHGRVTLISPVLDLASRTAQVRIELANRAVAGGSGPALLPDMVVDVELASPGSDVLVVPESAVLYTGPRTLVFVDLGEGRFRQREIHLGARSGDAFIVLSGLASGDRVVTSGQFLLDAESRLKGSVPGAGS